MMTITERRTRTMADWLFILFAVSSFSAFLLNLANKWGFVEFVQVHGNDFFAKMFNCWFCLSWWVNVVVCVIIAIAMRDWRFLLMPFISTIITKNLI